MSRDTNGNYSLPLDPVVPRTEIEASWANTTMDDIATALTNSLDRSGNGTMNAPLQYFDGSQGGPGIAFVDEPSSGFYRAGLNDIRAVVLGAPALQLRSQSGVDAGDQRPVAIYNGTAFQAILKGDNSESPVFKGFTTSGSMTVDAGGADITGGLTVSAGGFTATGAASANLFSVTTLNSALTVARGYVTGSTATLNRDVGIASVSRSSAGVYIVTFDAPVVGGGAGAPVVMGCVAESSHNICYKSSTAYSVQVLIEDYSGTASDANFTIMAFVTP